MMLIEYETMGFLASQSQHGCPRMLNSCRDPGWGALELVSGAGGSSGPDVGGQRLWSISSTLSPSMAGWHSHRGTQASAHRLPHLM